MIPTGQSLRVVGDVHGDARAFAFAAETDHFIVQLGDLTDGGPDNAGALRLMFQLMDEGRGLFLLGNHDRKLGRVLAGERVKTGPALDATLEQLDAKLRDRALYEIGRAQAWLMQGERFFVHAAFHTAMLGHKPPAALGPVDPLLSRALFGETTGRTQPDGSFRVDGEENDVLAVVFDRHALIFCDKFAVDFIDDLLRLFPQRRVAFVGQVVGLGQRFADG